MFCVDKGVKYAFWETKSIPWHDWEGKKIVAQNGFKGGKRMTGLFFKKPEEDWTELADRIKAQLDYLETKKDEMFRDFEDVERKLKLLEDFKDGKQSGRSAEGAVGDGQDYRL